MKPVGGGKCKGCYECNRIRFFLFKSKKTPHDKSYIDDNFDAVFQEQLCLFDGLESGVNSIYFCRYCGKGYSHSDLFKGGDLDAHTCKR